MYSLAAGRLFTNRLRALRALPTFSLPHCCLLCAAVGGRVANELIWTNEARFSDLMAKTSWSCERSNGREVWGCSRCILIIRTFTANWSRKLPARNVIHIEKLSFYFFHRANKNDVTDRPTCAWALHNRYSFSRISPQRDVPSREFSISFDSNWIGGIHR